jgi:hypothetical protein
MVEVASHGEFTRRTYIRAALTDSTDTASLDYNLALSSGSHKLQI